MTYGVQPTGFVRKALPAILADMQEANVEVFGPGVIQTAASPLGQVNGLLADLAHSIWELAELVYQSLDPDQAEGLRLDHIGAIRGLARNGSQSDAAFSRAITNRAVTQIKPTDALGAINDIDGVSWASVIENSSDYVRESGLPAHSLAFAVIGGDDDEVAEAIYRHTVPGIGLYGMTTANVAVDGYCRQINFIRPNDVVTLIDLVLRRIDGPGCASIQPGELAVAMQNYAISENGFVNGMTLSAGHVMEALSGFGGLEIVEARFGTDTVPLADGALRFSIFDRPAVVAKNVTVRFV